MMDQIITCAMVKSRYIGDGHPTLNRNPHNGCINPYYWVDDHPLLYGNFMGVETLAHIKNACFTISIHLKPGC